MSIAVIGVPFNSAGRPDGVAAAPAALRSAGLLDRLREAAGDVEDRGDVAFMLGRPERDAASGLIAPGSLVSMVEAVRDAVSGALSDETFPLVLGGDCPVLLGCLAAARNLHGRVGLMFVDGHEDAWPPKRSPTGEAADTELGLALGRDVEGLPSSLVELLPLVRPKDVALLGPRDGGELREANVPTLKHVVHFLGAEALTRDARSVASDAASRLSEEVGRWWLHVDLDVLSTEAMPAVDYPQPGGLSWETLQQLTTAALQSPGIIGWDVTIYNPDLDPGGRLGSRVVDYISACLPQTARR